MSGLLPAGWRGRRYGLRIDAGLFGRPPMGGRWGRQRLSLPKVVLELPHPSLYGEPSGMAHSLLQSVSRTSTPVG